MLVAEAVRVRVNLSEFVLRAGSESRLDRPFSRDESSHGRNMRCFYTLSLPTTLLRYGDGLLPCVRRVAVEVVSIIFVSRNSIAIDAHWKDIKDSERDLFQGYWTKQPSIPCERCPRCACTEQQARSSLAEHDNGPVYTSTSLATWLRPAAWLMG